MTNPRPSPPAWLLRLAPAAVAASAAGCETLSQDMRDLGSALIPLSPGEAARLAVDPHDPDARFKGTVAISNSPFGGEPVYLTLYRDRVKYEDNPLVRSASIAALGRFGTPEDAPAIASCLADEHPQVRWEAAKSLQRLHDPAVVPVLLRVLRDNRQDPEVRYAAAIALGQYPEDRVFQGLVGALGAVELSVNLAALRSLSTLSGQDHGLDPRAWLAWYGGTREPFAGGREYLYPTYRRDESWLEKLAFWSSPSFEQPGSPAGLAPRSQRRTYQESEPPAHETGG